MSAPADTVDARATDFDENRDDHSTLSASDGALNRYLAHSVWCERADE